MNHDNKTAISQIIEELKESNLAVFLGAGVSVSVGYPDWNSFVKNLADKLEIDPDMPDGSFSSELLRNIPQYYENEFGRSKLLERLDEMKHAEIMDCPLHSLIVQLPVKLFYTTNFDRLLEQELRNRGEDPNVIFNNDLAKHYAGKGKGGYRVIKLHGSEKDFDRVITRDDFAKFSFVKGEMIAN
ncbi:MAG: SIR2 family protein [Blastocatellia bacterium]